MPHLAHVASWATALNSASNRGSDSSDTPPPPSTRFFFLAAPPLSSLQLALPPLSLPVAGLCFGGLPTFFLLRTSPPWWPMSTPLLPFPPAPFPPDFPFLGPPPMLLSPSLKEPSSLSSPRSFASTAPEAEETAAAAAAAAATVAWAVAATVAGALVGGNASVSFTGCAVQAQGSRLAAARTTPPLSASRRSCLHFCRKRQTSVHGLRCCPPKHPHHLTPRPPSPLVRPCLILSLQSRVTARLNQPSRWNWMTLLPLLPLC
mmetsp:Transcript_26950/g.54263  ORF Transcript_26950/g.54263 Transcript_26950/m.54263 type:complete len:261 (-) Transcript_26950:1593-2375(-)